MVERPVSVQTRELRQERGNGRDAPIPAVRVTTTDRLKSTEAMEKRGMRRGSCAGIALGFNRLVLPGASRIEDVL